MRRGKRGAELSMNVIIIAILVIIVLVVVAAFFMGGFSQMINKINQLFTGRLKGTDIPIAVTTCESLCQEAQLLSTESLKSSSSYCTKYFYLEWRRQDGDVDYEDEDGKKNPIKYYCDEQPLSVGCPGVTCGYRA
jgi:flagellar basal body-associated protein FliL